MSELEAHVVWADGLGDTARECIICGSITCIKPVHADQYKTIANSLAAKWDKDNPVI